MLGRVGGIGGGGSEIRCVTPIDDSSVVLSK